MGLTDRERRLLRLFTATVIGEWPVVRDLRRRAPSGEPDRAWRETLLQTHLFAGFPRLVQAFGVLAEEGGVGTPGPDELEGHPDGEARGRELFETIYGEGSEDVRGMLHGYHRDFGDWILEHAYARVLSRPGLDARFRELLAAGALATLGQERQLASHARGAIRCGATYEDLLDTLEGIADLIEPERLERAREIATFFRNG